MLDILRNWNRWGSNPLKSGHQREVTKIVCKFIELPEIIALIGLRRVGKSTILFQIMDELEARGVPTKAMLYVNFEDPGFANALTPQLLDNLYRIYREEVYPEGRCYLFFDEVQNIPEWERWVSARNETEAVKIFVSGSSAQLMSRELATLLTGRHVSIQIHPLSFGEYLKFRQIALPTEPLPYQSPPIIQAALKNYMQWGGLPRIALETEDLTKRYLLREYLDNILFKDIALRHSIRNLPLLRDMTVFLLTQTSSLIAYKRLASLFQVSQELAQSYCHFIQEAFLIELLPYFSLKMAERNRHPQKCHIHDLGFRKIANMSASNDFGKLAETVVYNHLARQENDGVFYWKKTGEVDFVVRSGIGITQLIQVVYDGLEDKKTLAREVNALLEAQQEYREAEKLIITATPPNNPLTLPENIKIVPLWRFLLN